MRFSQGPLMESDKSESRQAQRQKRVAAERSKQPRRIPKQFVTEAKESIGNQVKMEVLARKQSEMS